MCVHGISKHSSSDLATWALKLKGEDNLSEKLATARKLVVHEYVHHGVSRHGSLESLCGA